MEEFLRKINEDIRNENNQDNCYCLGCLNEYGIKIKYENCKNENHKVGEITKFYD